jgi:hypothetical protein
MPYSFDMPTPTATRGLGGVAGAAGLTGHGPGGSPVVSHLGADRRERSLAEIVADHEGEADDPHQDVTLTTGTNPTRQLHGP